MIFDSEKNYIVSGKLLTIIDTIINKFELENLDITEAYYLLGKLCWQFCMIEKFEVRNGIK